MEISGAAFVCAVFLLAGGVKGITGMGLPTVAVSLLTLWMTPTQAAGLLVLPSLLTNVAQCRGPHWRKLARMLWPAWLALAIVTVWAPDPRLMPSWLSAHRVLGLVLIAYGLWGLWRPGRQSQAGHPTAAAALAAPGVGPAALVGVATGLVSALTAVFVMPLVPYLQALRLDKDSLVQALGISFTVATIALAVRLHAVDALPDLSPESVLALPAAFVGLWLGSMIRARISTALFQRALFVVFVGLGAANLLR